MILILDITNTSQSASLFEFNGPLLNIGRSPECHLCVENDIDMVSWNHAAIEMTLDGAFLRDHGSTNGTFVNDRRLSERTKLKEGDIVRLGQSGPYLRIRRISVRTASALAKAG